MTNTLFGSWQVCADKNHYFLAGTPLCGRPVRETGVEPPRFDFGGGANQALMPHNHCPECLRVNIARWLNRGQLPTPTAA